MLVSNYSSWGNDPDSRASIRAGKGAPYDFSIFPYMGKFIGTSHDRRTKGKYFNPFLYAAKCSYAYAKEHGCSPTEALKQQKIQHDVINLIRDRMGNIYLINFDVRGLSGEWDLSCWKVGSPFYSIMCHMYDQYRLEVNETITPLLSRYSSFQEVLDHCYSDPILIDIEKRMITLDALADDIEENLRTGKFGRPTPRFTQRHPTGCLVPIILTIGMLIVAFA